MPRPTKDATIQDWKPSADLIAILQSRKCQSWPFVRGCRSAPPRSASAASSIVWLVEFDPAPAMIGTQPRATPTATRTISCCSLRVRVAASPVVPQTTNAVAPSRTCRSQNPSRAPRSRLLVHRTELALQAHSRTISKRDVLRYARRHAHAAMACGVASSRRAEMTTPSSQRVPASIRKPNLSRIGLSVRLRERSSESIQTTSTPAGARKCTSQFKVVSSARMVYSCDSTRATSYWPRGRPQVVVIATREYPRRCSLNIRCGAAGPDRMIRCKLGHPASLIIVVTIWSPGIVGFGLRMTVSRLFRSKAGEIAIPRYATRWRAVWTSAAENWESWAMREFWLMSSSRSPGTMITA
jgi:hypothetical protein